VPSSSLQSPRLRRIVTAYTVNRLGTWFGFVALSVAVFEQTHSTVAVAALLIAAQVLPAFAAPAIVARIEAADRRGELSGLYLFEGVATTALAVLLWHFWLPAVLLLVALDGTAALAASSLLRAAAARTARAQATARGASGSEPHSLSEADAQAAERRANAALNIAFSVTFMLGPVIAGVVVAAAGGPAALLIDAASFLVCGALLTHLRPHVEEAEGASVRARLLVAWRHINDVPALRALLLAEAVALVFFEFSPPIEIAYAKMTLHAGTRGYGLLLAVWGVGVAIGSLIFARSSQRPLGAMLSAGTLAVGLAYIGFALAPFLALACLAALLGGIGNGVQWASLISAVQRLTPPRLHGRLMGAVESLGALCPAIGLSLGGALAALSSPRTAFLVAGLGATATTVAFMRLSLPGPEPAAPAAAGMTAAGAPALPLHEPALDPTGTGRAEPSRERPAVVHPASRTP
jgi:MFS family permease